MSEICSKEQLAGLLVFNNGIIRYQEQTRTTALKANFFSQSILLVLKLPQVQTRLTINRCYSILDKILKNQVFRKDFYPNPFTGILNINGIAGKWATFERE